MRCSTWVVFKILKVRTRAFGFSDIYKHFRKSKKFNMCGSQDIAKVSLHRIIT